MTKAEKIRQTRQETLERRTQPQAFVVEAKLCPYSLSADQKKSLSAYFRTEGRLFSEALQDCLLPSRAISKMGRVVGEADDCGLRIVDCEFLRVWGFTPVMTNS